jgi:hypothetical protein
MQTFFPSSYQLATILNSKNVLWLKLHSNELVLIFDDSSDE